VELAEPFLRGRLGRGGVDGAQVAGHGVPVGPGGEPEGVADQVQHAGLHDGEWPGGVDRVREALEPVVHDHADVDEHHGVDALEGAGEPLGHLLGSSGVRSVIFEIVSRWG
jgi:hypothetical protein